MKNLIVFSLALFGSYYTHATPNPDLRETRVTDFKDLGLVAHLMPKGADPKQEYCLDESEKQLVADILRAEGKASEAIAASIEEFQQICRPR